MTTLAQRSFVGGEIAPVLYARPDLQKVATGVRTMRNVFVGKAGGAYNRPGTNFICEVKDSTKTVRLIPFEFSDDQTYMLEFGDEYMRPLRSGSQQYDLTLTITGISNANPGVVTYTGTDPANGDEVYISGVIGALGQYVNNRNFRVANVNTGANTFELNTLAGAAFTTVGLGSYGSAGTAKRVYTIVSPYDYLDLPNLKFVQSADVITITHPSYEVKRLSRSGHTSWSFASGGQPGQPTSYYLPSINPPTAATATNSPGTAAYFYITAIKDGTFEESWVSAGSFITTATFPASGANVTVGWTASTGAVRYNIYKETYQGFGFIGTTTAVSFVDGGIVQDFTRQPPMIASALLFDATGEYPAATGLCQQRLALGGANNTPQQLRMSVIGSHMNFTQQVPTQDDSPICINVGGVKGGTIRHIVDAGKTLVFTSSGEYALGDDSSGVITPESTGQKQLSANGSSHLAPILVNGGVLYVQDRGNTVLSLGLGSDGIGNDDLTIFASHLLEGKELVDWTYQQIPNSIVWAVRDDGELLGMTYNQKQGILAWHHHDFDGTVENVCAINEGTEHAVYLVIKRTINSATKRYIERLATRFVTEATIEDAVFMDCTQAYDGRNTVATTMTLSGGTLWDETEELTLTASSTTGVNGGQGFLSTDVDNAVFINGLDTDGEAVQIRGLISEFTSTTVVRVRPSQTVPTTMRSVATTDWAFAKDQVTGLWAIEGEEVSVFGDGFVVASPNNAKYGTALTVTNGAITLDQPHSVIQVGLPYISDIETLDIDTPGGSSASGKKMIVQEVSMQVEKSRGIWMGPNPPTDDDDDPLENLIEIKVADTENMDKPVALASEKLTDKIMGRFSQGGRTFIRQVDPLPMAIMSYHPTGFFPFGGR